MADYFMNRLEGGDWPDEAEEKYERIEILGKGSFGMVWMAQRRIDAPVDEFDDEFVAIKNIHIADEKGKVYAEREISILSELKHPHVIRLIKAYPLYGQNRVVVMQLARGPNLHQLIVKRGALGLPLCRLVSRQLIAAVGYLHGRAVIHRDIKPSNCILASTYEPRRTGGIGGGVDDYDWYNDASIWSNGSDCEQAVKTGRWQLMLVDFGFARALEKDEVINTHAKHLRNSIVFENEVRPPVVSTEKRLSVKANPTVLADVKEADETDRTDGNDNAAGLAENGQAATVESPTPSPTENPETQNDDDMSEDSADLQQIAEAAALSMRGTAYQATNELEDEIMGKAEPARQRQSGVSMPIPVKEEGSSSRNAGSGSMTKRTSTARKNVRSMSALGTKAYAAPEIRKKLRHKTEEDFEKANAAMTECVADYGMIVDAYSVGWTLRVAMTGVPPNFTISEYMRQRDAVMMDNFDYFDDDIVINCCCFSPQMRTGVRVRDPSMIPHDATLLIASMTEKNPEDRITVREAQNHPWITGIGIADEWKPPQGDVPSQHGDPVVPLQCAEELSRLTVEYHMQ